MLYFPVCSIEFSLSTLSSRKVLTFISFLGNKDENRLTSSSKRTTFSHLTGYSNSRFLYSLFSQLFWKHNYRTLKLLILTSVCSILRVLEAFWKRMSPFDSSIQIQRLLVLLILLYQRALQYSSNSSTLLLVAYVIQLLFAII